VAHTTGGPRRYFSRRAGASSKDFICENGFPTSIATWLPSLAANPPYFVDVAFKLVQSQAQFTHSDMGQNIPAVVERVAVTPSSVSRTTLSEEAYPVCMTSVWSASGVIENRIAVARISQACAAPPAETDSTGSDASSAARSQPANVAPISYVLR
jgi:hypothetical protein